MSMDVQFYCHTNGYGVLTTCDSVNSMHISWLENINPSNDVTTFVQAQGRNYF